MAHTWNGLPIARRRTHTPSIGTAKMPALQSYQSPYPNQQGIEPTQRTGDCDLEPACQIITVSTKSLNYMAKVLRTLFSPRGRISPYNRLFALCFAICLSFSVNARWPLVLWPVSWMTPPYALNKMDCDRANASDMSSQNFHNWKSHACIRQVFYESH